MENKKEPFANCNCGYCQKWGWPSLWHIPKLNLHWFETPKNGTVSIKWGHKRRHHITVHRKPETSIIVVWRDPVDRFKSIIKHYFIKKGGRYSFGVQFLERNEKDINKMSKSEIVDFVLDNLDKLTTVDEVHHFYPQVAFIKDDFYNNFEFIQMKDICKRFCVNTLNVSQKVELQFTETQIGKIKEIYKKDYEFYNKHIKQVLK